MAPWDMHVLAGSLAVSVSRGKLDTYEAMGHATQFGKPSKCRRYLPMSYLAINDTHGMSIMGPCRSAHCQNPTSVRCARRHIPGYALCNCPSKMGMSCVTEAPEQCWPFVKTFQSNMC
jgi:hypothetical protein